MNSSKKLKIYSKNYFLFQSKLDMQGIGGSSGEKPATKGKEDVKCKACDKVVRKDEMKKHWDQHHKDRGKTPSWKFKAP